MPEVLVRRCTLTIRRRDGWSWGPDPRGRLEEALAHVEAAIAAAIDDAELGDDATTSLRDPVRIHLVDDGGGVAEASRRALVAQLREARARATPVADGHGDAARHDDRRRAAAEEPARTAFAPPPEAAAALARTLACWSRGGRLADIAKTLPSAVVRAWLEALRIAAARPGAPVGVLAEHAVDRVAKAVLAESTPRVTSRETGDVELLVLLGALVGALGERLPAAPVQLYARTVVLGGVEPEARDASAETPAVATAADARPAGERPETSTAPARRTQPDVVSALPFLVLAQLARVGYTDAVCAAASATGAWIAPGLAAAIAGKVLARPDRDWRRRPEDAAAVAFAGGMPLEDVAGALAAVAGHADLALPPLRAALEGAYAEGRSSNEELLVTVCEQGVVCGEATGALPVAWVGSDAELDDVLASLGRPPVRRDDRFADLAAALHERRALPRLEAPALERHLGAAVGTALGLLALELWSESGPTSPLLALERLADLEARVRVTRDELSVAIPRGRRWLDLRRAELLGAHAVVWLPGGRLAIGTW